METNRLLVLFYISLVVGNELPVPQSQSALIIVPDFKAAGGIRLQFKKSSDVPIWHGSKPFESLSPGGGRLFFVDEAVDWILLQIVDEDRGSWDGAIRIAEISSEGQIRKLKVVLKNDQQYADAAGSLIANCFVSICEVRRSEPAADVADSVQHVPAPPVMIHKDVQTLGWDNSAAERDIQNANELGPISEKQRKVILGTVLLVVVKLLTRLRELHEKKGGRLFLYPDNNQSVVSILAKPLKADKLVMTTVSIPPSGDSILLTRKNNVDALKRGYRAQVERLVTSYKATVGNNNCNSRPTIQQTKKQTLQDKSTVISQQKAREKLSVAMPRRINLLDLQKSAAADNKKVPAEIKPRVTKSNLISSNFVTRPFVSTYRQNMMTEPVEKPNEAGRKRSSISSGGGSLQELPMDDDSEKNPVNSNEGNPSMAVKFHANIISNNGLGVVPNKHNNLSSIVTSENSQQNTLLKSGMRNPSQSKSSISKSAAEEEDETSTQSSSRKTFPHSATVSSSSSVSEKSAVESQRTTSSSSSTTTTRSGSSSSSMSSAADGKSSADSSNKTKSSKSEDKSQGEKSSRSESSTENEHVGSGKISSQSTASSVHSDIKCSLRGSAAGAFTSENSSSQTDSSIATEIDAANGDDHDHSLSTTEQVISRSRSTESSEESIESSTNRRESIATQMSSTSIYLKKLREQVLLDM